MIKNLSTGEEEKNEINKYKQRQHKRAKNEQSKCNSTRQLVTKASTKEQTLQEKCKKIRNYVPYLHYVHRKSDIFQWF